MIKFKNILINLFFIGLCISPIEGYFVFRFAQCYAQEVDLASQELFEYGLKLYNEEDFVGAAHEFEKTLMVNPRHSGAIDYLNRIIAHNNAKVVSLPPIQQRSDLLNDDKYQKNLKSVSPRFDQYRQEIEKLKLKLQGKDRDMAALKQELALLKQEVDSGMLQKQSGVSRKDSQSQELIKDLNGRLDTLQLKLASKDKDIEKLHAVIDSKERDVASREEIYSKNLELLRKQEEKIKELEALNKSSKKQENGAEDHFNDALIQRKNEVEELKGVIRAQKQEIYLSGLDKERSLADKEKEINSIRQKIARQDDLSIKSSLALKDKQITILEKQVNKLEGNLSGNNKQSVALKDLTNRNRDLEAKLSTKDQALILKEAQIAELETKIDKMAQSSDKSDVSNLRLQPLQDELVQAKKLVQNKDNDLKSLGQELLKQREQLDSKLSSKDALLAYREKLLSESAQEIESLRKKISSDNARLEADLAKKDQQIIALTEQLSLAKESAKKQIKEPWIDGLKNKLTGNKSEQDQAKDAALSEKNKEINLLKEKIDSQKKEHDQLLASLKKDLEDSKNSEIQSLRDEFNIQKNRFDAELATKDRLLTKNDVLVDEKQDRIELLQSQLDQAKQLLVSKEQEFQIQSGKRGELDSLKKKMLADVAAKEKIIAQKNDELSALRREAAGERKQLKVNLEDKEKQIELLQKQLNQSTKGLSDKVNVIDAKEKDLAENHKQLEFLRESIKEQKNQLAAKDKQIESLQGQLTQAGNNLVNKDKLIAEKEKIVSQKDEKANNSAQETSKLQKQLAKDKQDLLAQLADKDKLLDDRNAQIKQLQIKFDKAIKEKDEELGVLNKNIASQKKEFDSDLFAKNKRFAEKDELISKKDNQLKAYEQKIALIQDSLEVERRQSSQLNKKIDGLQSGLSEKEKQLKDLADKIKQLQDLSVGKDKDNSFLQSQVIDFKKTLTDKDAQIGGLEVKHKELAAEIAKLQNMAADFARSKQDYEAMLADKDKKLSILRRQSIDLLEYQDNIEAGASAQIAQLREAMDKLNKSLSSEIDDYKARLELASNGLVVTILSDILFDSGSSNVSMEGEQLMNKISDALANLSNDNHIVIEGYTDNEPIKYSRWKSNWELSTARALSILHYLIDRRKLDPKRFSASGYGEYRPVADNGSASGRRQNRRVEIIIQPPKIIKVRSNTAK